MKVTVERKPPAKTPIEKVTLELTPEEALTISILTAKTAGGENGATFEIYNKLKNNGVCAGDASSFLEWNGSYMIFRNYAKFQEIVKGL